MYGAAILFLCLTISARGHTQILEDEALLAKNQFTLDLLKVMFDDNRREQNVVISSPSVYTVLAEIQQGAKGKSLQEMNQVLHLTQSVTKNSCKNLTEFFRKKRDGIEIQFANKIFVKSKVKILPEFKKLAEQNFLSDIQPVNFKKKSITSKIINLWSAQNTRNRIVDIIKPDDIDENTVMMLLNAVFFSGKWANKFNQELTGLRKFYGFSGKETKVPTMHLQYVPLRAGVLPGLNAKFVQLPFLKEANQTVLRLPYKNYEFAMLLIVPDEKNGIAKVVKNIKTSHLADILKYNSYKYVTLQMPKFAFSTDANLKPLLQKLGVKEVFSDIQSNLSGISTDYKLYISAVKQVAKIEIDEYGATAAAVTVATLSDRSSLAHGHINIMADHPFLFYIIDVDSKVPLFSGWIASP